MGGRRREMLTSFAHSFAHSKRRTHVRTWRLELVVVGVQFRWILGSSSTAPLACAPLACAPEQGPSGCAPFRSATRLFERHASNEQFFKFVFIVGCGVVVAI